VLRADDIDAALTLECFSRVEALPVLIGRVNAASRSVDVTATSRVMQTGAGTYALATSREWRRPSSLAQ
jgi:hypothetical protein